MSFFRWLSLGLAVFTGMLVVAWTLALLGPRWFSAGEGVLVVAMAATAAGLVAGVTHRLATGAYEKELRRAIARLERHGSEAPAPVDDAPPLRFGLNELVDVAEASCRPLRDSARTLALERRELEASVRHADQKRHHLEAILHAITDAVIVTDAFNEIALANQAAARLLGFELATASRRPVEAVVADDTLVQLIKQTRAGGHAPLRQSLEHRIGHNGQACVCDVTLACVSGAAGGAGDDSDGDVAAAPAPAGGVVTILRDVTREKRIQEMKSDFVSNVSHELRTPLSSIKAYMEMLVDGEAHDEQTRGEFYNIIQSETNRLSRLIDNILNISQIESGLARVQREYVELAPLLHEAVEIMLPQARARAMTVDVGSRVDPACAYADRDMVLQAVINCLGNAIKYTPEGGRVTVELLADGPTHAARIAVTDTGVGIPAEDLPHLFEKFYRVSDHKKLAKGSGLGLPLVKHVIETVHGGSVSVTSRLNRGSTFTLSLPMAEKLEACAEQGRGVGNV